MKSIDVMAAVLGYMISHIKTEAAFQGLPLTLKYVLTIPTCACKGSRTFMTEAALKVIKVYKLFFYLLFLLFFLHYVMVRSRKRRVTAKDSLKL